jgi:hypothetical protein
VAFNATSNLWGLSIFTIRVNHKLSTAIYFPKGKYTDGRLRKSKRSIKSGVFLEGGNLQGREGEHHAIVPNPRWIESENRDAPVAFMSYKRPL